MRFFQVIQISHQCHPTAEDRRQKNRIKPKNKNCWSLSSYAFRFLRRYHIYSDYLYIFHLTSSTGQHTNMVKSIIAPSLLAGDFSKLGCECCKMFDSGSDWVHLDVMDGHFVPNITMGPPIISSLRNAVPRDEPVNKKFFDCHMMVANPEQWVEEIANAGGDQYTFHYESTKDPKALIKLIKQNGMKAACAIKPNTSVDVLFELADLLDMALIMTVEPGFGGQKFMENMMPKVEKLRELYPNLNIQVDGGLGKGTVEIAAKAGANVIVAGTSVFKAEDPIKMIQYLRNEVDTNLDRLGIRE